MKRKRIVVHIGYPKTATTTLQRHYFSRLEDVNYLGIWNGSEKKFGIDPALVKILVMGGEDWVEPNREKILEFCGSLDGRVAFLSRENILGTLFTPRINSYGFLQRVTAPGCARCLRSFFDEDHFDLNLVVTIRRQDDALPSQYAQSFAHVYSRIGPLSTFDKFINDILLNKESFIRAGYDYYKTVSAFVDVFGKERVTVIPFEMFRDDRDAFIRRFMEALGSRTPISAFPRDVAENVREQGDGSKRPSYGTLFDNAVSLKKLFLPGLGGPGLAHYITWLKKIRSPFQKDPGIIRLDERRRQEIFNLYRDSNRNISEMFDLDLGSYGYF